MTTDERDQVKQLLCNYEAAISWCQDMAATFADVVRQLDAGVPAREILTEEHAAHLVEARREAHTWRRYAIRTWQKFGLERPATFRPE